MARRRTALTRTAKPCGPGTRCWCQVSGGKSARPGLTNLLSLTTVTRRIRSPGRARNKPLKPLRAGMPGDLGCTCGDYARVLHLKFCTRGYGCGGHPAFPTPSVFLGRIVHAKLGRIAPRECEIVFYVIARSQRV